MKKVVEVVPTVHSAKPAQLLGRTEAPCRAQSPCGQEGTSPRPHCNNAQGAGDQDPHPGGTCPVFCPRWAQLLPGGACAIVTRVKHVVPSLLAVSPEGPPGWLSSILLLPGLPSTQLASEPEAAGVMQYCSHARSVNRSSLRLYFKRVQKGRGISAIGAMLWP